jgi:hypothetical protein
VRYGALSVGDLQGIRKSAPDEVLKSRGLVGGICNVFALNEFYFHSRFRVRVRGSKWLEEVSDGIDRGRPLQDCVSEYMIDAYRNGTLTSNALMRDCSSFRSAVASSTPRAARAFALSLLILRVMARTL